MSGDSFADQDRSCLARVFSLCQKFVDEWDERGRPDIFEYLAEIDDDSSKQTLLRNLMHYELQRCRKQGETPTRDEYTARFPQFARLVEDVFQESDRTRTMHWDGGVQKPPPVTRLGDYLLVRELGRGAMGMVFEAIHQQRGNRVALKTLPRVDAEALHQFKREFRSQAGINHPNLVGLHKLECDGSQWFFTMDLVEGTDFLSYVRPSGYLDAERVRAAFAQLMQGVLALHDNHVVHRDLKPSNVMVTSDGHVLLLDFGLVTDLERSAMSRDGIVGTPAYMAPEQAAGESPTVACDFYAMGVMLYEALVGQPPFTGSARRVMRDKQRRRASPLEEHGDVPDSLQDLAGLCMLLLHLDAQVRIDAIQAAADFPQGEVAAVSQATGLEAQLVGRQQQMTVLRAAYDEMGRRREPITVLIRGDSGEGKTTLAERFLDTIRDERQATILSGRCYDSETAPFRALDSLIDAVGGFLGRQPRERAAMLIPDDIGMLAQLFPELQRVDIVAEAANLQLAELDEMQVRQRAFESLRRLLSRIGTDSPLILFIDDLQWGDADSAEALFQVMRPPHSPRILFLGVVRQDEAADSQFLRRWNLLQEIHDVSLPHRDVRLGPLSDEECAELVVGLLAKDSESVRWRARELAQEARGNPYLLIELVSGCDAEAKSFETMPMQDVLARKLRRLPDDAARLLDAVAVSGRAVSLLEASQAAGHEMPAIETFSRMRNERLVRLLGTEQDQLVDTYHDRIRETVLHHLSKGRHRAMHRKLGQAIEAQAGCSFDESMSAMTVGTQDVESVKVAPRVYDLAYHFDAGRDRRRAWLYGLLAAEQARKQFSPEVAAEQYALANDNACKADASATVKFRIALGHGQSLMLLGRYTEADQQLAVAASLTEEPVERARVELFQAETAFKQSAIRRSIGLYEQALRRLKYWVPRSKLAIATGLLYGTLIQCLHTLLPSWCYQRKSSLGTAHDLAVELLNRLSMAYYFRNSAQMLWAHIAGMNQAERSPPSRALAFTYGLHPGIAATIGLVSRGVRYGNRALEIARAQNDLLIQGHTYTIRCIALLGAGRFEEGIEDGEQAVRLLRQTGDTWLLNHAHLNLAFNHFGLGNLSTAIGIACNAFERAMRLGEHTNAAGSIELLVAASQGQLPFQEIAKNLEISPDDVLGMSALLQAEGTWHKFNGRHQEAVEVLQRAWELPRRQFVFNAYAVSAVLKLAAATRVHAQATQSLSRSNAQLWRRALGLARLSARLARFYPFAMPESLRELSLLMEAKGRINKALKFADRSCTVAERQKASYEHAQSLLVRGKLARRIGLPDADSQIQQAEAALESFQAMMVQAARTGLAAKRFA